jgi:hypothetical protein
MASDLPETGFDKSTDMAKVLVTYMDDAHAIRARLREDFHCPPTLSTIRRYRNEHLAGLERAPEAPHKAHEGYYPDEVSRNAEERNKRFVEALERERALSVEQAKREGALDSPSLRHPEIVDQAWDRETEQAWLENGELRL